MKIIWNVNEAGTCNNIDQCDVNETADVAFRETRLIDSDITDGGH